MVSLHCVVLVVLLTTPAYGEFRSDYEYNVRAKGWFKLHSTPSSWDLADLRCHFEGGVLASPLNKDMQQVMTSLMSKNRNHTGCAVHIGVHNKYSNDQYVSVEGVPLNEIAVQKNKVFCNNYSLSEHCMRMYNNSDIVPGNCTDALPYICFRENNGVAKQTECGTIDKGYSLDSRTGHCYKFHNYAMAWSEAYMVCDAEGGYLAIINSDLEANILKDLFARNPATTIVATVHTDVAHLGIIDSLGNGVWRTIYGADLHTAGFARWSPGEPNENYDSKLPKCGLLFRNGLLVDNGCNLRSPFICEMEPQYL